MHAHLWHGQYVKQQNPSQLLCTNQQSMDHLLFATAHSNPQLWLPLAGGVLAFSASQKRKQAALVFLFVQYWTKNSSISLKQVVAIFTTSHLLHHLVVLSHATTSTCDFLVLGLWLKDIIQECKKKICKNWHLKFSMT